MKIYFKAESLSSTISPFAIRCGLGSRVAVLFSESEHDSYCTEHLGQILLTLRRRQSNWIQLPACPSDAIFGRHGEVYFFRKLKFLDSRSWSL